MIRVLIVDDQDVVSKGLRTILNTAGTIEVIGIAQNGAQALELVETYQPDLVLMDLKMPIMNGILATQKIRQQYPGVYVLVLTTFNADEWVFDAIRAGASGYLLKDADGDEIITAIEGTIEGRTYIDPAIGEKLLMLGRQQVVPNIHIFADLSEREVSILKYMARGLTNHEIGQRLHLADGTVRNNISAILRKLAVQDRTQAAALAWHHGLVNRIYSD